MQKFIKRLDRWVDMMIDAKSLFPGPHRVVPITLKMVFENLRYYTVLAFMWIGVRLLRQDVGWPADFGAPILMWITVGLGLLTAWQTTWIAFSATFTSISMLLPPRLAVRVRRRIRTQDAWMFGVALTTAMLIFGCAVALGGSILSTLSRSNLL